MKKHLHILSLMLLAVLAVIVTGCGKQKTDEGMVLIPAGDFLMGSNSGWDVEKPLHWVYVDAFYMDAYEVTNAEYAAFLNAQGKHADAGGVW